MDFKILLLISTLMVTVSAWTLSIYPVPRGGGQGPPRIARFIHPPPPPQMRRPIRVEEITENSSKEVPRPKRNHHDYDPDHRDTHGVAGPVHTFVKTDKNANYKWGVRHHVGNKYASQN